LISVRFGHVPVGSIINLAYNQSDSIVWWLVAPEIWGGRVVACAKEKKNREILMGASRPPPTKIS
jgi:hypothetical protein